MWQVTTWRIGPKLDINTLEQHVPSLKCVVISEKNRKRVSGKQNNRKCSMVSMKSIRNQRKKCSFSISIAKDTLINECTRARSHSWLVPYIFTVLAGWFLMFFAALLPHSIHCSRLNRAIRSSNCVPLVRCAMCRMPRLHAYRRRNHGEQAISCSAG